jgi:hypothetical protein
MVTVRDYPDENLNPKDECALLGELKAQSLLLDEEIVRFGAARKLFENIENETERTYWLARTDTGAVGMLNGMYQHGFPLPKGMPSDAFDKLTSLTGRYYHAVYGNDLAVRLGVGRFIGEVADLANNASLCQGASPSLYLFSAHDTTIAPLMEGLKVSDGLHPPMGTAVVLEVYNDPKTSKKYFQLFKTLDGKMKSLIMPSCPRDRLCDLDIFLKRAAELTPTDWFLECDPKNKTQHYPYYKE